MNRSLKIALVLSVATHLALLLIRLQSEPVAEGSRLSLDVRLDVSAETPAEAAAAAIPQPVVDPREAEAPAEGVPDDIPPEAPETLLAEATTPPTETEPASVPAEPQPAAQPAPEPVEPVEAAAPEPVEAVAEAASGPTTVAIPETPVQAVTPLQSLAPRPAPARDALAPPETPAQPVRRAVAFTEREQRMLDRKVEVWAATFHRLDPAQSTVAWRHRGQDYTATFRQLAAPDDRGIDELLIEISKQADGETLSTELHLRKLAFSNFAQFIDKWDPRVSLHDDEIGGRFHSNTEVHLAFDRHTAPVFHGKVTTSFRGINTENARGGTKRADMFLGGLQTGVRRISLPRDLTLFRGEAQDSQVHRFAEDTRLTFYPDGTFGRRPVASEAPETRVTLGERSAYLIAAPKVSLYVSGTVNGAVLVYSPRNIVIEDDLVYASDPQTDPEADDYLGLVSERFVRIAGAQTTGDGDLVIHGSIYAKRRFSVGRFRTRNDGTLIIYGSLTAGSISATEPRYRTRIEFDPRLNDIRAPGFPLTDRYEVLAWDGRWAARDGPREGPETAAALR